MKLLGYGFGALLVLLGVLFLAAAGAANTVPRLIIGGVILAGGIGLIAAIRMRVPERRVHLTQKIDLTGDASLEEMTCRSCGAPLSRESVSLQEGAIYVTCEHCNSTYQIEEEPKW